MAAVGRPAEKVDFADVVGQEAVGSEGHPGAQQPVAQLQQSRAWTAIFERSKGWVYRE